MSKSSKPPKHDDGRMSLGDHLRELRNRLVKSVLAIVLCTIVAAYFKNELLHFLMRPLPECGPDGKPLPGIKHCAKVAVIGVTQPFNLTLKVCLLAGLVATVPIWLYQAWAFISPGLHRHEKRYTLTFLGLGTPLFLGGVACGYLLMPTTIEVLGSFTPIGAEQILPVEDYLNIATRMLLVFGLAFEFPLLLVMLNLGGVLSGKRMLGWWRAMVMAITVFAAVATPSADPVSMLALASPIWVLYFVAVGFALLNDRRRLRRNPDAALSDEEASHLDLSVEGVEGAESVAASAPAVASAAPVASVPPARGEQVDDDIT
ncbi:twin-arginine translocase subunit TatC [Kitasatospora sp. NBC_01250]|uniref:twin-arginine translocase subunit TatC n=1 Tax=unclassified Kitasatospora TaxID=2633591 RepID=UPI002E12BEF3|nr:MULTISPECIES: twin-arginine translocase subunit TatC [unclassified Kitasatospora]WSJ70349.1 twin-arginine translocase subunit TatC [Kitasatospora sp. NBC_01302]